MTNFLLAIRDFVLGLLSLNWPGIGLPCGVVILGL